MWAGEEQKRVDACDVVVVGAGLVGAAVATRLTGEGFDVAVLEAQNIAEGATGRSAGMVLTGLAGHYNWAVSAYGRQKAREVWELTVEGRRRLVEKARKLEIPVGCTGSLSLAVEDIEADALGESVELLREDGFDAQFLSSDPLDRGFRAALHQPDDVVVDAVALTQALLSSSQVIVHESTEVYSLEPERGSVRVWAQGRTVLCSAVVLAVNGYASLLAPYFSEKVAPTRGLVLVTEPLNKVALEQPCRADYGYEYCRQLPDRRLLLGGRRRPRSLSQETGDEVDQGVSLGDGPDDALQEGLLRFVSRHFPEVKTRIANRWSGLMGFTPDGLPLLGRLPGLPQVYFTVGFGGQGLAWAFVLAERLVELMLNDADPGPLSATRLD
jgi:glycine/D-amino acid oxidase-like deaminating enzyme